jgi:hypothetical protein
MVRSQIETKIIFPLNGIFTSIRKCRLQLENLDNLIFVNKNWPNDHRVSCKSSFSLIDVIEMDVNLEANLKEFERAFERDEIMEL